MAKMSDLMIRKKITDVLPPFKLLKIKSMGDEKDWQMRNLIKIISNNDLINLLILKIILKPFNLIFFFFIS